MQVRERELGSKSLYHESFPTIWDFLLRLEREPCGGLLGLSEDSDKRSPTKSRDSKTDSLAEAVGLLRNGWDGADLSKRYEARRDFKQGGLVSRRAPSYVGFAPIVPAYLMGLPLDMMGERRAFRPQRDVRLVRYIVFGFSETAETMLEYGAQSLALVSRLEEKGFRVALHVAVDVAVPGSGDFLGFDVRVKGHGERIAPGKVAFPLAHPSMLRRIYFRWLETCDRAPSSMAETYGKVPSNGEVAEICRTLYPDAYVLPSRFPKDYQPTTIREIERRFGMVHTA